MLEGHAKRIYRVKTGDRMQVFDLSVKEPEMIEFNLLDKRAQDEPPDYERLFESTDQKDLICADALMALAQAMIAGEDDDDDPSEIPAGYTYLGQLIFHDITWFRDEAKSAASASLDLDSVLGNVRRNAASSGPVALSVGKTWGVGGSSQHALSQDLPRLRKRVRPIAPEETEFGFPLIPDYRNDDFLPLAQLHVKFLQFHNAAFRELKRNGSPHDPYSVKKCVIEHFQSLVLSDFLPAVADKDTLDDVMTKGRRVIHRQVPSDEPFRVPLEFATAVGRYGHAMIASQYDWNDLHHSATISQFLEFSHRNSLPSPYPDGTKMQRLDRDWVIDWSRFFASVNAPANPSGFNHANKIGPSLISALGRLPERISTIVNQPMAPFSLAEATLSRQRIFFLATAQSAIKEMRELLHPDPIPELKGDDLVRQGSTIERAFKNFPALYDSTPLWYYVLREAEIYGKGNKLGPVGSRILVETIHASIEASTVSIFRKRNWKPSLTCKCETKFTMADVLAISGNLNPLLRQ